MKTAPASLQKLEQDREVREFLAYMGDRSPVYITPPIYADFLKVRKLSDRMSLAIIRGEDVTERRAAAMEAYNVLLETVKCQLHRESIELTKTT